jgi:Mce-associated membrane protein
VVLAVLTALAVAAAVWVTVLARQDAAVSDARTAATQAARGAAEVVLGYDHSTLDEDFAAALEVSTGAFREEYRRTSENAVRDVATQTQAVVEAEVVSAGVVSATSDEVTVLMFVNQTTTSNRLDQPQTDQNRVRFTMTLAGGSWKVSEVDAL